MRHDVGDNAGVFRNSCAISGGSCPNSTQLYAVIVTQKGVLSAGIVFGDGACKSDQKLYASGLHWLAQARCSVVLRSSKYAECARNTLFDMALNPMS